MLVRKIALFALVAPLFVGCASVQMESKERSTAAKTFAAPAEGKAGVYIYRNSAVGGALKKDLWIDGTCLGETAPNVFFYEQVAGGVQHKFSTESEFSPNDLTLVTEAGKNYFLRQYIKIGVFVGGAGLEQIEEAKGRADVASLELATKGKCSK